jgi:hypothetical protein
MKIESFFECRVDENQTQSIAPLGFAATLAQYRPQPKVAAQSKRKELIPSMNKYVLDDFGSFIHSFKKCLLSRYFQRGFFICIPFGRVVDIRSTQLKIRNRTNGGWLPCR